MITKNYKKLLKALPIIISNPVNKTGSLETLASINGSSVNMMNVNSSYIGYGFGGRFRSGITDFGITFGTGTTPPTENDNDLESPVYNTTGSLSCYYTGVSVNKEGTKYAITYQFTVTNKSSSPKTITEIGLILQATSSPGVSSNILIDRTVLETPIVLPADNSAVPIKYTMEFDWDI